MTNATRKPKHIAESPLVEAQKSLARVKSRLSSAERKLVDAHQNKDSLEALIKALVDESRDREIRWQSDRRHGRRKVGAKLQTFAVRFQDLLARISGVVTIVDTASGAGYGSIVYEGLSTLLVVSP